MQGKNEGRPQKILVVDKSRVVRASLVRSIRKHHGVCEVNDGDAAWHSLVLDTAITALVSGLDITGSDGVGLLERVRSSRMYRIRNLPFYQLASESLTERERQRALQLGVTAFVPKTSPAEALVPLLCAPPEGKAGIETGSTSDIGLDNLELRLGRLADLGAANGTAPAEAPGAEDGRRAKRYLEQHLAKDGKGTMASVIIFGIDAYADLCERFGQRVAEKVADQFSGLLRGKVRTQEDVLILANGRIGIASGHIDREQCVTFARRICKALAAATISVGEEMLKVTVSAGVAAMPQDGEWLSAEGLFHLASRRLEAAAAAGGNQVIHTAADAGDATKNLRREEFLAWLDTHLKTSAPDGAMQCEQWLRLICAACNDARADGRASPCSLLPGGGPGCACRLDEAQ